VEDAPFTEDLDLNSVITHEDLAGLLRTVHVRADKPSLRSIELKTRHDRTRLSKTVLSEMLRGTRLPRKAVMVAFLRACGVREDGIELWQRAWERIAEYESGTTNVRLVEKAQSPHGRSVHSRGHAQDAAAKQVHNSSREQPSPVPVEPAAIEQLRTQINRLNADNNRLRLQLADIGRGEARQEPTSASTVNVRAVDSPLVCRRELGTALRRLRGENGLTVEQVAEQLVWSVRKIRDMEANFRVGRPRDVRDLCEFYGLLDEAERDRLITLAREGRQKDWWQFYALEYSTYVGLEAEALSISSFHLSVIHGLLQTADYARAGHESAVPRLAPDQIEKQIEAKLIRQHILTREDPAHLTAILDEAALYRKVGGRQVMAKQLTNILAMSALPNVVVQVLPYELGAHPALESNFTVLELPSPDPGVVYVEGLIGSIYLERAEDLKRYRDVFEALRSMALGPEETVRHIARLRNSYEG
jgi:transcriptional regulator with XRE-family HTH domain